MSTEKLTTDYVLSELKGFYSGNKSGNGSGYPKRLLNTFLAREVEQQTKQLREERDRAVDLINRANGVLNYSGFAIHPESPFAKWVKDFLNQLNQNNEG